MFLFYFPVYLICIYINIFLKWIQIDLENKSKMYTEKTP